MTTLCLIRHGETSWNVLGKLQGREDIELNEKGKAQANQCVDYLSTGSWTKVITSPLKRAKETAEIFSDALNLGEVEVFEDLIEMDFGLASGLTMHERSKQFPTGVVEGQETKEEVVKRTLAELERIHALYPNEHLIIVTHGMVLSSLLSHLTNGKLASDYRELKNTCVNVLKRKEDTWDITLYNYSHLD